jgi:signal transduction histidine kinase
MFQFGFNQEVFIPITTFLILISLLLYKYLSKNLFDDFYKSDKEINTMIQKTLHELNTPIATIEMNTKMIQKNIANEKDIKRLYRINEACENLKTLYNKTEYAISASIDKIKVEEFEITEIINNSLNKLEDIKKDIIIESNLQIQNIKTDKYGFEIMIDNLLSNAIKYNKKNGKIYIQNQNNILKISDTGCGIEQKNILLVYDRYFQIDTSHQGKGLGLYIVKEYCDNNNISIKIDSQENKGTSFYLDLNKISEPNY